MKTSSACAAAAALVLAACASAESWPGPSRPFRGKVHAIPGILEAEDFDEGGEGVAYHDAEPANLEKRGAPYRDSGVDLEWRPAALAALGPRGADPLRAWAWGIVLASLAGYPALRLWAFRVPQDPPAVSAGSTAPDFTLPDAEGRPVSLRALAREGRVLLVFFRGPG